MSNTPFVESLSTDPIERAIARKVTRLLNDSSLDRQLRVTLIKKSQRDLIRHRQQMQEQQKLQQQLATTKLPQGSKPQSIQVRDGRVQVGLIQRRHSFTWFDAGQAPQGVAANHGAVLMVRQPKSVSKRSHADPIAERRRDLGIQSQSTNAQAIAA